MNSFPIEITVFNGPYAFHTSYVLHLKYCFYFDLWNLIKLYILKFKSHYYLAFSILKKKKKRSHKTKKRHQNTPKTPVIA